MIDLTTRKDPYEKIDNFDEPVKAVKWRNWYFCHNGHVLRGPHLHDTEDAARGASDHWLSHPHIGPNGGFYGFPVDPLVNTGIFHKFPDGGHVGIKDLRYAIPLPVGEP